MFRSLSSHKSTSNRMGANHMISIFDAGQGQVSIEIGLSVWAFFDFQFSNLLSLGLGQRR